MSAYAGPIRAEPPPIELHNTLYAERGALIDGLATPADLGAWFAALADRLPADARRIDVDRLDEFQSVRAGVREALHAAVEGRAVPRAALAELNRLSARSPESLELVQSRTSKRARIRHHGRTPTDVALGLLAASTIALVTGRHATDLRACGAPGCVLMFLRNHPRREWCSAACGNRARQARHYARERERRSSDSGVGPGSIFPPDRGQLGDQ